MIIDSSKESITLLCNKALLLAKIQDLSANPEVHNHERRKAPSQHVLGEFTKDCGIDTEL